MDKKIIDLALVLAIFVIGLGAYTRLSDAGLGCPDWPGCYGKLVAPMQNAEIESAAIEYGQISTVSKAWTEMVHRYFAGVLGLLVFALAWVSRREKYILPWGLSALVIFQALLGMWTVSYKLHPLVVMGHLLGGMLLFAGLCWYKLNRMNFIILNKTATMTHYFLVSVGAIIIFLQIALGGWVSSNYAALVCVGFPKCNGIWPQWSLVHVLHWFDWLPYVNFEGGVLGVDARVSIHWLHRIGAGLVFIYVSTVLFYIYRTISGLRGLVYWISFILCVQVLLGISNVVFLLPKIIAVSHNIVAAILWGSWWSLIYGVKQHMNILVANYNVRNTV